jgi:hypothetical protein
MRRWPFLMTASLLLPGIAAANPRTPAELAVALADRWKLSDDAVLVAEAGSNRPLLCLAAVHETGDSIATEKLATLACDGRIARWIGDERWVRTTGLAERWSGDTADQLVVLYAFAADSGPTEAEIQHWLELAMTKDRGDDAERSITVRRGLAGLQP